MTGAFDALLRDVRACTACAEHLPCPPRPVLQAHPSARILIASQAPGRRVHESGIPFDDPSGDRLREWMAVSHDVFYDPTRVAVLPMGFCYPGTGASGDHPPRKECAPLWRPRLLRHLPHVELTLLVGAYAQRYVFGPARSLTKVVADWRATWPSVVPLPHPSPRNNPWLARHPWFERDVVPALRVRCGELLHTGPDWGSVPVFGTRDPGLDYVVRPSAYGMLGDDRGRVGVVRTPVGVFLPGGGVERDETPTAGVVREFREECALAVEPGVWRAHALQYILSEKYGEAFVKRSTFMDVRCVGTHPAPSEADHEFVWMTPGAAQHALHHESHRWAVESWVLRGSGGVGPASDW